MQQQQQPPNTIDPAVLQKTKEQIRKLIGEIDELADSDIQPNDFYVEFLKRVVAAVAASGGALWLLDGRGGLRLFHQLQFEITGLLDGRTRTQPHDKLLGSVIQSSQPQIMPPSATIEGVPDAGNPTALTLILAPLIVDKQCVGVVEVVMDPSRKAANQKSTLRFIGDLANLASKYLKNRQMRQLVSQQQLWSQLEGFSQGIHKSLDLKETCFAVSNSGKQLIGADRLSVALKINRRTMVEAVSGQEVVEQRSNLVRELTHLCKLVIRSGEDLHYTGSTEGLSPELQEAIEIYVDESGSKAVSVTLLYRPVREENEEQVPFGCLVTDQMGDEIAATEMQARSEVIARHASLALWNAREHHRIFLKPLWHLLGSPWRFFRGRTLAKIAGVLLAVAMLMGMLAFVPWELTIPVEGALYPEQRQITYAPVSGVIREVNVVHGQQVKKGDVLCEIRSDELDKEYNRLLSEYSKAEIDQNAFRARRQTRGLSEVERMEVSAQLERAKETMVSTRDQLDILERQFEEMKVVAPVDGIVTTWEVRKTFQNRPVEIGTELITVASTDQNAEWLLEVNVKDKDMGPILDAKRELDAQIESGELPSDTPLDAYFVLANEPSKRYRGYVKRVASKAEMIETDHMVKVTIGFSEDVKQAFIAKSQASPDFELRPGSEVTARIECGEARLAYVLLRDVVHFFYETILFRWPFLS